MKYYKWISVGSEIGEQIGDTTEYEPILKANRPAAAQEIAEEHNKLLA